MLGQFVPALGQSYNLGSNSATIPASNQDPVAIRVGDHRQLISPGQMLTPAEAVALSQVLHGGKQTILINQQGSAVGGRFSVTSDIGHSLGALNVPNGVTALANFSSLSTLNFSGDLSNAGKFYSYSNNPAISTANINASNIFNLPGGLISTVIPNSLLGITGAVHNLNMTLTAANINNAGSISSSGSLILNASDSLVNSASNAIASLTALQNLTLNASNIVNSGIISSTSGNINITAAMLSNILVNNTSGSLQALLGDINVRDISNVGKTNFQLLGGDLLSKNLNVFGACGSVDIDARNVTGVVNISAGEAHVTAATPNLQLGTLDISGDPTYFNTNGNITLSGDVLSPGADVAIVARGDVTSTSTFKIDTSSAASQAGAITIIAGAKLLAVPIPDATDTGNSNDSSTALTVVGPSATGGSINFSAAPVTIDATSKTADGGKVTVIGMAGADAGSGQVNLGNSSSILTGGINTNGDVTLISGAVNGTGMTVGTINTVGDLTATGTGGVIMQTSSVTMSSVQILDGTMTGTITAGATQRASMVVGSSASSSVQTDGANILMVAGQDLAVGSVSTQGGNIGIFAGGNITSVFSGAVISTTSSIKDSGRIAMFAGVDTEVNGSKNDSILIKGPSFTGGSILLNQSGAAVSSISTASSSFKAGDISLVATLGNTNGSGRIETPSGSNISSGSGGDTLNGSILLLAGANASNTVSAGSINSAGGPSSDGTGSIAINTSQLATTDISYDATGLATPAKGSGISQGSISVAGPLVSNGDNITVLSGGNIQLAATSLSNALNKSSSIVVTASGTITLNGNVTNTTTSTTSVPTVLLTANSVNAISNSGISSRGQNNGGIISITAAAGSLTFGSSAGELRADVRPVDTLGGKGAGAITINAGKDLTINSGNALQASGAAGSPTPGGTISIAAGTSGQGNVKIVGTLSASSDATTGGNGGTISISTKSTSAINIGDASGVNGITGVDASGKSSGSISINNTGTGGLLISNSSSLQVGDGGSIALTASSNISVSATNSGTSLKAPAGTITLKANSFVLSKNLQLNVDGSSTALNAGTIDITSTGFGATANRGGKVTIGNGINDFALSANGDSSSGNAGTVSITAASNISIATAGLQVTAGASNASGGTLILKAGLGTKQTGTVFVDGPINLKASASAPLSGGHLSINTNSTQILTISDGSKIPVNGVNGAIDISGSGAGSITLSNAAAGVSVLGNLVTPSTTGSGATVTINATKGDISLTNAAGLDVSSQSGAAGSIALTAAAGKITYTKLSANGSVSGAGGSITMQSFNAKVIAVDASKLTVSGSAAGNITVTNTGAGGISFVPAAATFQSTGDAGQLTLNARGGGNVTVSADLDLSSSSGNGGAVILSALKGNVSAFNINVSGGATKNGGAVQLTSNSSKPFVIDPLATVTPVNGLKGSLNASGGNGGSISIMNIGGGVTVPASALSMSAALGNAGNLNLNASKGDLFVNGNLNLSNTGLGGSITLVSNSTKTFFIGSPSNTLPTNPNSVGAVSADGATGGKVLVQNLGTGGIGLSEAISASGTSGAAGSIIIDASSKGKIAFVSPVAAISLSATSSSGTGGTIRLNASSYSFNANNSPVAVSSSGTTGGSVSIYSALTKQNIAIGAGTNAFNISATGSNGAGGIVAISSGGDLTVDVSGLSTAASGNGNGANISLFAGTAGPGNLQITGSLSANGQGTGNGGMISLLSNGTLPFFLDGSTGITNGITGSISATGGAGGNIGVKNTGTGGMQVNVGKLTVTANSAQGGSVALEAPTGSIAFVTSGTLDASAKTGSNKRGGGIIISAQKLLVNGINLLLSADSDGNQRAGQILVTQLNPTTPLVLGSQAGQINVSVSHHSFIPPMIATFTSANNIDVASNFGDVNASIVLQTNPTGTGTIKTLNGSVITSQDLRLNTGLGDIGATQSTPANATVPFSTIGANNLQTAVSGNFWVDSKGGNIYIQNRDNNLAFVDFKQFSNGKAQFMTLSSNKDIGLSNLIGRGNTRIDLSSDGNIAMFGNLFFKSFITAPQINIKAAGTITQPQGSYVGEKNASLLISAGAGDINLVSTNASTIKLIGNGANISLNNLGTISNLIIAKNTQFNNVTVSANGSIALVREDATSLSQVSGKLTLKTNPGSNGSIIISTPLKAADLNLDADGFGNLIETVSILQIDLSNSATLKSGVGNIGSSFAPYQLQAPTVTLSTGGAGMVYVSDFLSTGVTLKSSQSGGAFQFDAGGQLTISGDITAKYGFVDISINNLTTTGLLKVDDNVTIFAGGAGGRSSALTLDNASKNSEIQIGNGAQLISNGQMNLTFNFNPGSKGSVFTNSNFNIYTSGSNNIYLAGDGTVVANGPTKDAAFATGADILFYTGTTGQFSTPGKLTIDEGASFTARAPRTGLTSLDFTDKVASDGIRFFATQPNSGIKVANLSPATGAISSGDIYIDSSVDLTMLAALNIPAKVTVHFTGFDQNSPIGIRRENDGNPFVTPKNISIAGKLIFEQSNSKFTSTVPSSPQIAVLSTIPGATFSLASTGSITSDANLTVFSGGDASIAGSMSAPAHLSFIASAGNNFKTNAATPGTLSGAISLNGKLTSVSTTGLANLDVSTTAGFFQTGGAIQADTFNLKVVGSNQILQKNGTITAKNMNVLGGEFGATFSLTKNAFNVQNASYMDNQVAGSNLVIGSNSQLTLTGWTDTARIVGPTIRIGTSSFFCTYCTAESQHLTLDGDIATSLAGYGTVLVKNQTASSSLLIDGDSSLHGTNGVTVLMTNGAGNLTVTAFSIFTTAGNILVDSKGSTNLSNFIEGGQLANFNGPVFAPWTIQTRSAITVNSAKDLRLSVVAPSFWDTTNDITVKAANIDLGSFTTIMAYGGNVSILGSGNISSGINNKIEAHAYGSAATNITGGVIELSAGSTVSTAAASILLPPGTRPLDTFGASISGSGAVQYNVTTTGIITLNSILTLQGGAITVTAKGKTVSIPSATLKSFSYRPISYPEYVDTQNSDDELIVDADDGLEF